MTSPNRLLLLAAFFLGAAWPGASAPAGESADVAPVLHILTWEAYFDSEVLNQFQKKYDCEVSLDYYDSNDIVYATVESRTGAYDLITPAGSVAQVLEQEGLLLPLDHGKIPNLKNLDRDALVMSLNPEMRYSVPYTQTFTCIAYNMRKVDAADLRGWSVFANPSYSRKMSLLDDMREVFGAALKSLGCSLNTTSATEIDKAGRVLAEWQKNIDALGLETPMEKLLTGEYLIVQAYDGDIAAAMMENEDINFHVPDEGVAINSDVFVIAADTPLPDLAHAFINHMLDPEMARQNMESIYFYMPNKPAMDLLRHHRFFKGGGVLPIPPETLAKCEVIVDLGVHNDKYEAAWGKAMGDVPRR